MHTVRRVTPCNAVAAAWMWHVTAQSLQRNKPWSDLVARYFVANIISSYSEVQKRSQSNRGN